MNVALINITDAIFKIMNRLRDVLCHYLRKPFIGKLGKGSYIKSGTKIVGNPYRIKIGKNFKIWENCLIGIGKGQITIGDDGLLGVGSVLNTGNKTIQIGNGVAIAPHCKIFAYSHHYSASQTVVESIIEDHVIIEDDVLIGAGVVILPGVTIGRGSIIAAGSVVIKSVAPNTIVGGIPAKQIKIREN